VAECDWAILCDYAFQDARGKMCLIGIFNSFTVPSVPTIHPQAALVIQLKGDPDERFRVRIEFVRPVAGAGVLQKMEGEGAVSPFGGAGVALNLQAIQLPDAGVYKVNVYVNDELSYVTTFAVRIPEVSGVAH
jgi:hypothetical protein